jgi:TPR repeat protein
MTMCRLAVSAGGLIMLVTLPIAARAVDPNATSGSESVMQDARPGEYYYNLGADAVQHKDYGHAVEMYQVSASWAYKISEFNLGVMYARGEGVPVDLPRAMAWMTLAAERQDKQSVQARDLIAAQLDKDGIARAEAILRELLPIYGDEVALARAKRHWHETRTSATGSHLGFIGNLGIGTDDPHSIPVPGSTVYADLRATDNPYDPRLDRGVATVGPVRPLGEQKGEGNADEESTGPAKPKKRE